MNNLKMKNKSLNNINILDDDLKYIHQNFDKKILFKNKSILITGYLGFIGFELTNYLIGKLVSKDYF